MIKEDVKSDIDYLFEVKESIAKLKNQLNLTSNQLKEYRELCKTAISIIGNLNEENITTTAQCIRSGGVEQ